MPDITSLLNRAVALHRQGQLADSAALYEQIIAREPEHADALHLLGVIAGQQHDAARALALIDRAIAVRPDMASFHSNRGNALRELKRLPDALAACDRAIGIDTHLADAWHNRGLVLADLSHWHDALSAYDRAIALQPGKADAWYNRGMALRHLDRMDEALVSHDKAIELDPRHVQAWFQRGNLLHHFKRDDESIVAYDQALAIDPGFGNAHCNRGNALRALDRAEEALASYAHAIEIEPDKPIAWMNRGLVLRDQMRLDESMQCYEHALQLRPSYPHARLHKALLTLMRGDLEQGWPLYEARWQAESSTLQRREYPQPQWDGEQALRGKTLLLYSEQGMGDTIQFCRYASLAARRGAKVILEVPRSLVSVIERLDGASQVIAKGEPTPKFDLHCPLLSLPLAFGTTLDTIPAPMAYLRAARERVASWRVRLGHSQRLRIGLTWSGNPDHRDDRTRSIPLSTLLAALPRELEYLSLQRDIRDSDRGALEAGTHSLRFVGDELTDFDDTAALCMLCDLIISVDTSSAHLAAALGRETWMLLPQVPDWRWLLDRADSPWYPTMTLFRQPNRGDWNAPLKAIRKALDHRAQAR